MNKIAEIFSSASLHQGKLQHFESLPDPRSRYIIAMTPRSGSSYLCDVLSKTRRFGMPGEFLNEDFIPDIMKKLRVVRRKNI